MSTTARRIAAACSEGFTRKEYALLPEGLRAYLLDGMFVREPAPTWRHQSVAGAINDVARAAAPGRVLFAPADVVIDDRNVLQPDVMIFAADVRPGLGADPEEVPVVVVEVLSPSTERLDREVKTSAYLRAGVREVWLVDATTGAIDVAGPEGVACHTSGERVASAAVPGFALEWSRIEAALRGDA